MAELKEWAVSLVATTEHNYTVLARTAEEAGDMAEQLFDSGEEGVVVATSVESLDAVSGEISAQIEDDLEESEQFI